MAAVSRALPPGPLPPGPHFAGEGKRPPPAKLQVPTKGPCLPGPARILTPLDLEERFRVVNIVEDCRENFWPSVQPVISPAGSSDLCDSPVRGIPRVPSDRDVEVSDGLLPLPAVHYHGPEQGPGEGLTHCRSHGQWHNMGWGFYDASLSSGRG
ncbi:unnamed protein product, partial [Discosporangium mesarthrocarpum]